MNKFQVIIDEGEMLSRYAIEGGGSLFHLEKAELRFAYFFIVLRISVSGNCSQLLARLYDLVLTILLQDLTHVEKVMGRVNHLDICT